MDHLQPASFVLAILMATTAFVLAAAWLLNKAAFSLLFRTDSTKEMLATGAEAQSALLNPNLAAFHSHYGLPCAGRVAWRSIATRN